MPEIVRDREPFGAGAGAARSLRRTFQIEDFTGTGSEIRQPLGYAMVGGLIVSQALTLFTTPVVYLYLDRLSNTFARWGRSSNPNHDAHLDARGSVKQAAE